MSWSRDPSSPLGWTKRDGFGNSVVGPPASWPRKVGRFVRDQSIAELALLGQVVLGYAPSNEFTLVPGQRALADGGAPDDPTLSNVDVDGVRYRRFRRTGEVAKGRTPRNWGPFGFHHIVDPTGAQAGWSVITQDLVRAVFTSGNSWLFYGFGQHNTDADETTKTGALWWIDSTTQKWTSGVYEGTGTPTTTLSETVHDDLTAPGPYRLGIVLNAEDRSIDFYADGSLVHSFVPSSPIGEMSKVPLLAYYIINEASADAAIDMWGGSNPRFVVLTPID